MVTRQTRIFAPPRLPYDGDTWAETLLGRVIRPLVANQTALEWFWFSRYAEGRKDSNADSDIGRIPTDFEWPDQLYRSVRFRFQVADDKLEGFERNGHGTIQEEECAISDWRPYDLVSDLGGDRFVGEDRDEPRRVERAQLVVAFLQAVSRLVLHSLIGPVDGRFGAEENGDFLNPLGSSFESMHHMFCNITCLPLRAFLFSDGSRLAIGTRPDACQESGWGVIGEQPILF